MTDKCEHQWISVKDRLPNENQIVLTLDSENSITSCTFKNKKFIVDHFCEAAYITDTSHWMTLPSLPEEK
jgi:hypothetical protein